MHFVVTAYLWGVINDKQYILSVKSTKEEALAVAKQHHAERAGQYGVCVTQWLNDRSSIVLYFPSKAGEPGPQRSERMELLAQMGLAVVDIVSTGLEWTPPATASGSAIPVEREVPEWLSAQVRSTAIKLAIADLNLSEGLNLAVPADRDVHKQRVSAATKIAEKQFDRDRGLLAKKRYDVLARYRIRQAPTSTAVPKPGALPVQKSGTEVMVFYANQ